MKYSISHLQDIHTISVKASGIINTKTATEMVIHAGATVKAAGYDKCLFDLLETTLDDNQLMSEMFMFISIFKQAGFDSRTKIAALISKIDDHRKMLESSARHENIGLKHFLNRDDALEWLCS